MKQVKRIPQDIMDIVWKINPKQGRNTDYITAWDVIATHANADIAIVASAKGITEVSIYIDDKEIYVYKESGLLDVENGDFDFDAIYRKCILYLASTKGTPIFKLMKGKKVKAESTPTTGNIDKAAIKKQKDSLYHKIRQWKKSGKDTTAIEAQYEKVKAMWNELK